MRKRLATLLTKLNTGRKQVLDTLLPWKKRERTVYENIDGIGIPETLFLVVCIYIIFMKRSIKPNNNSEAA